MKKPVRKSLLLAFVTFFLLSGLISNGNIPSNQVTKTQNKTNSNKLNDHFQTDHSAKNALVKDQSSHSEHTNLEIPPDIEYSKNELIVTFDENATEEAKIATRQLVGANNLNSIKDLGNGVELLTIGNGLSVQEAMNVVAKSESVLKPEPNYEINIAAQANDPSLVAGAQWGMLGPSSIPVSSYGANAVGAWSKGYTGSNKTYVVVIDTGIEVTHPDLVDNIWINSAEANGVSGVDDDQNGFIDDVNGFDFVNYDATVFDNSTDDSHGTHLAGIIGATGNNNLGVTGVNWDVNIISAKVIGPNGGNTANAIAAINYATMLKTKYGLNIIATNNSWGGGSYSRALLDAIKRGGDAGILFVAAAGNSSSNNDAKPFYPAAYNCATTLRNWDCVISVGSLAESGALSSFSNYGSSTVDIAAPGSDIYSTVPGGYALKSGTSMATPFVTGALALCTSSNRAVPALSAKETLLSTATKLDQLSGKISSGGTLNIDGLVQTCGGGASTYFNGNIGSFTAVAKYTNLIHLNWADQITGEYGFQIQYSKGPAGCTGTFQNFAYVGPGINSYPARGLDEASFYCFKVIPVRDATQLTAKNSNMEITWTSNLPFVYGQVLTNDGIPVVNMQVNWTFSTSNFSTSSSTADITTRTDENGEYVIQVMPSTGTLWVSTPDAERGTSNRFVYPEPPMPSSMQIGGNLTVGNDDLLIDLTMPKIDMVSLLVKDQVTGEPVPGARVAGSNTSLYCELPNRTWAGTTYRLFPGANEPRFATGCQFWGTSFRAGYVLSDANGIARIPVVSSDIYKSTYTFTVTNPNTPAQIGTVTISSSNPEAVNEIVMPVLRTITGRVLHADGSPAVGIAVNWTSDSVVWQYEPTVSTTSAADGSYSLQVAPIPGLLWVKTPTAPAAANSDPAKNFPAGFAAGGALIAENTDRVLDLTLPKFAVVNLRATDELNGEALPFAKIQSTNRNAYCQNPTLSNNALNYRLFPDATVSKISKGCMFFYGTYTTAILKADSAGEVKITVVDEPTYKSSYTFTATHPTDAGRIGTKTFTIAKDGINQEIVVLGKFNISGVARMADGQPIKDLQVIWTPDSWVWTGGGSATALTDEFGNYSLRVAPGKGTLWVQTKPQPAGVGQPVLRPTPEIPYGFQAGGTMTVLNADVVKDLTMPKFRTIEVQVVDAYSNEPVPNAEVRVSNPSGAAHYCEKALPDNTGKLARTYKLFPEMVVDRINFGCRFWNGSWNSNYFLGADSSGKTKITVVDDSVYGFSYPISAVHNLDAARRVIVEVRAVDSVGLQTLVLPGTPSKPDRPSAIPDTDEVTLNWHEPWDGGAYIDYYEVHQALNTDGPYALVTNGTCAGHIDPTWRSCVVGGLTPGTQYFFAIVAHNVVGYGDKAVLSVMTLEQGAMAIAPEPTPSYASPQPSPIPEVTVTPAPSVSATPEVTQTPTPTPSPSVVATPTPTIPVETYVAPPVAASSSVSVSSGGGYVAVSAPAPATQGSSAIAIKSRVSSGQILGETGLTVTSKHKLTLSVAKSSKKVCKVSGNTVVATGKGNCVVTVKVAPKPKFKKTEKTRIVTWSVKVG